MSAAHAEISSGSIFERFQQVVGSRGMADAVIHGDERLSYVRLDALVAATANFLSSRGIGAGERVAIFSNTRPEVVIVFLACARLGAIYLGLSPRLSAPELAYVLKDAQPRCIFSVAHLDGRELGQVIRDAGREIGAVAPMVFSVPSSAVSPDFLSLIGQPGPHATSALVAGDDPMAIIYTSGSTGAPKGALLSNRSLMVAAQAYMDKTGLRFPRAISQLPIDHVGFVLCEMTAILLAGGALIQLPRFEARLMLAAIQQHRATITLCIPTMIQRMIESGLLDSYDLSSLEFLWWAGPLPLSSAQTMRRYSKVLAVSYGMTEACGTITFSDRGDPNEVLCSSVGRPHSRIGLRVVRVDDSPESPGEIQLRGPQLMLGYWNNPAATAAAFTEDGWFKTGDLGVFRGEHLSIVGRIKEMIRSGGYNIVPSEVEVALEEHEDIVMAFVCGVPDAVYGEAVHAMVHVREGAQASQGAIAEFLKKSISSIKVPKRIHFRKELPLLANGKLDRPSLRKLLTDLARESSPG